MNFQLSENEKISGKKAFEVLAAKGRSFFSFPCRIIWMETDIPLKHRAQVAFVAPKKIFKSAVKRNRIKRLLRETYRLHKNEFYQELEKRGKYLRILFVYTHRELPEFRELEGKIIVTLNRLIKATDDGFRNHNKEKPSGKND